MGAVSGMEALEGRATAILYARRMGVDRFDPMTGQASSARAAGRPDVGKPLVDRLMTADAMSKRRGMAAGVQNPAGRIICIQSVHVHLRDRIELSPRFHSQCHLCNGLLRALVAPRHPTASGSRTSRAQAVHPAHAASSRSDIVGGGEERVAV